jgi:hypothetical protein
LLYFCRSLDGVFQSAPLMLVNQKLGGAVHVFFANHTAVRLCGHAGRLSKV